MGYAQKVDNESANPYSWSYMSSVPQFGTTNVDKTSVFSQAAQRAEHTSKTHSTEEQNIGLDTLKEYGYSMIPDDVLPFASDNNYLQPESIEETLSKLPRKADGSYDTDKIKQALEYAVGFIQSSNKEAVDIMQYGIYGNQVNNINVLAQILSPEVRHILEKLNFDLSVFDTNFGLHNTGIDVSIISKLLNKNANPRLVDVTLKTSQTIKNLIATQDSELNQLLKLDLNKPENIEKLVSEYQKITQTSFSSERILEYQNSELSKMDQLNSSIACFGVQENLIDAKKNQIATEAYVDTIRGVASFILAQSPYPILKGVGDLLAFEIPFTETVTKGTKRTELYNEDNFTWDNMISVLQTGAVQVVINHIPFANKWILGYLQRRGITASNSVATKLIQSLDD